MYIDLTIFSFLNFSAFASKFSFSEFSEIFVNFQDPISENYEVTVYLRTRDSDCVDANFTRS